MRTRHRPAVPTGEPIAAHNRPTAALLPPALAAIAAEHDETTRRRSAAGNSLAGVSGRYLAEAEAEARKADAAASAEAARAGRPVKTPTANLDALHARRRQLEADAAALDGALSLIAGDAGTAITAEAAKPEHRARLDAARARLHTAAAELEDAAREAAAALGVVEWLEAGVPFDSTASLSVLDVVPALRSIAGPAAEGWPAVPIGPTIAAIARIAD